MNEYANVDGLVVMVESELLGLDHCSILLAKPLELSLI